MSVYDNHIGLAQSQGAVVVANGTPKPRVRARRGQATDPHSIAERLRRERIAERMKALQELVPNSNKTDKASMLDEIIEYVKFLQLQVKTGGTAAVAPLVADIPEEYSQGRCTLAAAVNGQGDGLNQDGISADEGKVASLMEEDMGTAMQFLQSKGLCLMPISLAAAISTGNGRPPPVSQLDQSMSNTFSAFLPHGFPSNFMMPSTTGVPDSLS